MWICVDSPQLDTHSQTSTHLLILICSHGYELRLLEHVRAKRGVRQLQDVISSHQVETRLVLVHRVQDGLPGGNREKKANGIDKISQMVRRLGCENKDMGPRNGARIH